MNKIGKMCCILGLLSPLNILHANESQDAQWQKMSAEEKQAVMQKWQGLSAQEQADAKQQARTNMKGKQTAWQGKSQEEKQKLATDKKASFKKRFNL